MKPILLAIGFFMLPAFGFGQQAPVQAFPLSAVRLLNSPFLQARQTDLKYMLSLDADRLLAPYLREAGLVPKAPPYGNWENTGLDGHMGGHYLSALSNMYAATADRRMADRLNYMLAGLENCQQQNGNGYVGGIPEGKKLWQEVAEGKIDAGSFSLNGKWVPLYNIHKLFAGLVDAYNIAGSKKAKDILEKLSNWFYRLTANLSDAQLQTMLHSEHGGLNEVFADVAVITGDARFLALARRLSHRALLAPLLQHRDSLTGLHANTQIPKVIGFQRIAGLTGDTAWAGAADFFWHTVVQHRSVSLGGNSVREHFNPVQDFSSMLESREGPETCNSYNMLKLSKALFLSHPSAAYLDYYERTLYNHILSSQHPGGGFVYFTPIRPRHYRVYSQPQCAFWCCVGSGMENHGKYGELIYAHNGNDLLVNLFIPSALSWKEKGLTLEQKTRFPFAEQTQIKLTLQKPRRFALFFRYPSWVRKGRLSATVNEKRVGVQPGANGYFSIQRNWKTGDVVSLQLPMEIRAEFLPDSSSWLSFVRGPIVLAAATEATDLDGLRAGDSRMGHVAAGPLYAMDEAPMIVASGKDFAGILQSVKDKALAYTLADLIYPARYKNLRLVPFYTLHDTRYMLYWRFATPAQVKIIQEAVRRKDSARRLLDAITADAVAPGEQQPESDHAFRGEKTEAGVYNNRHWRSAKGWFAYTLKNTAGSAAILRITYYGRDKNRFFNILVNDTLLASVALTGMVGDQFFDEDYPLPPALQNEKSLMIKFVAKEGSTAGGVYGVRLLKKMEQR